MGLKLNYGPGQTPLSEEATRGLKIKTILTQGDLDRYEQRNIREAMIWLTDRKFSIEDIVNMGFIESLHERMYTQVWKWAGRYRAYATNIGVPHYQISIDLRQLIDDALYWHHHDVYEPDELAIRFKHRLVSIHCFPNGNGRHSRLMADLIVEKVYGKSYFTWGGSQLIADDKIRKLYIQTLQEADRGSFDALIDFARS